MSGNVDDRNNADKTKFRQNDLNVGDRIGQARGSQRGTPLGAVQGQVLTPDQLRQSLMSKKKPERKITYAKVRKNPPRVAFEDSKHDAAENEYGQVWGHPAPSLGAEARRKYRPDGDYVELKKTAASSIGDVQARDYKPNDDYVQLRRKSDSSTVRRKAEESLDLDVFMVDASTLPGGETQAAGEQVVRGVLELSSLRQDVVSKVPVRLVCVFDVSGSMRLKCGRSRRESKLAKLKAMVSDMLDALEDDQDYVALVTFGVRPRTLCPMTRVDKNTRDFVKEKIQHLDKETDNVTDLSSGLFHAVDILKKDADSLGLAYKNAILVFSDGEINAGLVKPDELVHTVREHIQAARPTNCPADQWLSLACVTTGGNVSEGMYLLSKTCGTDAYYYVDGNAENPEIDMMIPILLRKSAAAQLVSIEVTTNEGAQLLHEGCSREHVMRRRRQMDRKRTVTYFLHDVPASTTKHFSLSVDVSNLPEDPGTPVMEIKMSYVDGSGCQHQVTKTIRRADVVRAQDDAQTFSHSVLLVAKGHLRQEMQAACRKAAEKVAIVPPGDPGPVLTEAVSQLQSLAEQYKQKLSDPSHKQDLTQFCAALLRNLGKLMDTVEKSQRGTGHKWTKIRAISSAIARESPGVSGMVSMSEKVCPLPALKDCTTTRMQALAMKLYQSQDVRSTVYEMHGINLFDAAKLVAQNLGDIIRVLDENNQNEGDADATGSDDATAGSDVVPARSDVVTAGRAGSGRGDNASIDRAESDKSLEELLTITFD